MWLSSPGASFVAAAGAPPAAGTRQRRWYWLGLKRMTPSLLQDPPEGSRRVGQGLRRAAGRLDALQLPIREEADRAAVGRPEELQRILGAGKRCRLKRAERADPDGAPSGSGASDECNEPPIGRDSDVIEGLEGRLRRHLEREPRRRGPRRQAAAGASLRPRAPQRARRQRLPRPGVPGSFGGRPRAPERRPASPPAIHLSSLLKSPALCQRSSGSLARQVRTTRSSAGGVMGWTVEIGAGSSFMIARSATPGSFRKTPSCPSPSRRARRRTRRCRSLHRPPCPRAAPAPCTGTSRGSCPPPSAARCRPASAVKSAADGCVAGAMAFARPKSRSFTPDFVSITLPGFRSRCTIPCRCARSRASAISTPHFSVCSGGSGPFVRREASVSPSSSSITRYSVSPSRPTSYSEQM